jgi:hypothetical protein
MKSRLRCRDARSQANNARHPCVAIVQIIAVHPTPPSRCVIGLKIALQAPSCPRQRSRLTNCRRAVIGCVIDYAVWLWPVSAPNFETPKLLPLFSTCNVFVRVDTHFPNDLPALLDCANRQKVANNSSLYWKTRKDDAMLWFKKREGDIEMEPVRGQKTTAPDDTEYRPINWKKILLSPKYIRMSRVRYARCSCVDEVYSLAHTQYPHSGSNSHDNYKTRRSRRSKP